MPKKGSHPSLPFTRAERRHPNVSRSARTPQRGLPWWTRRGGKWKPQSQPPPRAVAAVERYLPELEKLAQPLQSYAVIPSRPDGEDGDVDP